jgi:hypothetical protein
MPSATLFSRRHIVQCNVEPLQRLREIGTSVTTASFTEVLRR